MKRAAVSLVLLALAGASVVGILYQAGAGAFGQRVSAGAPSEAALPVAAAAARTRRQSEVRRLFEVDAPKQILFGDLHVTARSPSTLFN